MDVQSFVLISSFFPCTLHGLRGLQFLFAHFAKIAIKPKCVFRLPQSLAQMESV